MKELWGKFSQREKKLLIAFALIFAIYFIYTAIISTALQNLEQANLALEEMERKEQNLQIELGKIQRLQISYGDYQIEELFARLPKESNISQTILWIEKIFSHPGLSEPNIHFNLVSGSPSYLQVGLNFTGDYTSIHRLLEEIEGNEQITRIESINLNGSREMMSASLTITLYAQRYY